MCDFCNRTRTAHACHYKAARMGNDGSGMHWHGITNEQHESYWALESIYSVRDMNCD
jgi:hypothetical protein